MLSNASYGPYALLFPRVLSLEMFLTANESSVVPQVCFSLHVHVVVVSQNTSGVGSSIWTDLVEEVILLAARAQELSQSIVWERTRHGGLLWVEFEEGYGGGYTEEEREEDGIVLQGSGIRNWLHIVRGPDIVQIFVAVQRLVEITTQLREIVFAIWVFVLSQLDWRVLVCTQFRTAGVGQCDDFAGDVVCDGGFCG